MKLNLGALCFLLIAVFFSSSSGEVMVTARNPGLWRGVKKNPNAGQHFSIRNLNLRGGSKELANEPRDLNNRTVYDFDFEEVFQSNKAWADRKRATDPTFFPNLAKAQHPKILWIGCSDARVPSNVIMGADPGVVFVQRNIANMVLSVDTNVQAVIQYAVDFLKVPHIVVCGHYCCGGVNAAMQKVNHGAPLENWLRNIRDVHRLHHKELEAIDDPDAQFRRLVELNVVEQCLNLYKTEPVQRRRHETKLATGKAIPTIHGLVYDISNGALLSVKADIGMEFSKMQEMYEMYPFDPTDRHSATNLAALGQPAEGP